MPVRSGERDRNAARMRESRAKTRVVEIPPCENPNRRKRLEKDIFKWLPWYAADPYEQGFTDQIRTIIRDLLKAYLHGEDQGDAASRGEGKTTASEWVETFLALQGKSPCAILFEATTELADASLAAIMERLETNDRLAADYPEICIPVRALERCAQRARTQLVRGWRHDNGKRFESTPSHFKWTGHEIILPHVPGAPGAGSVIAARGLEKSVRGIKFGGRAIRPTVAIINDPDTENTINNPQEQGKKLENKIEFDIGGLGGQRQELARVILTTVRRLGTVSDRFTNPKIKPSFKGRRFRFLVKPPDRPDLWEEYVQLRQLDWVNEAEGNKTTLALNHYVKHRTAMDAGAVIANPNRRPGGQLSGLQFYYDFVARKGEDAAQAELNNNPPEETGAVESGITALRIQRQVNGLARGVVASGCTLLTMGIDCRKLVLHWVVRAWRPDGTPFTVDYGEHLTHGTVRGSDEGVDLALRRALRELIESKKQPLYRDAGGMIIPLKLVLVDSGWRTEAIYQACRELGLGVFPSKGYGRSAGCTSPNFNDARKASKDWTPGEGWGISRAGAPGEQIVLVHFDADRAKGFEHDRWMTEPGHVGALTIFGQPSEQPGHLSFDQKSHWHYARHIVAEVEAEEIHKGALRRIWKTKSPENHWLDASVLCNIGASVCGIRLLPAIAGPELPPPVATKPRSAIISAGDSRPDGRPW